VLVFVVSRNQRDMDKKRHLSCISQRSLVSLAQGKVTQVKIMLMPSCLDNDEKRLKEEPSCQAQAYSFMFYLSLEYRSLYYEEGCNMVILIKSKCSKSKEIPRVMKENQVPRVCWNLSYRSDRLNLFQSLELAL
jgi:hypothetical protein